MALSQIIHEPFARARERIAQRRAEIEDEFAQRQAALSARFEKDKAALEEERSAALLELDEHEASFSAAERSMGAVDALDWSAAQSEPAINLTNDATTIQATIPQPVPRTQREVVFDAVRRLCPGRGVVRSQIASFALQRYGKRIPEGNITTYLVQLRDRGVVRYVNTFWIPTGGWIAE
jgi:hypothetical protein